MTAFILAAGEATRWKSPIRKEHLHVEGKPLLQRTSDLFSSRGVLIYAAVPRIPPGINGCLWLPIVLTSSTRHTLVQCLCRDNVMLDKDGIIVLLGDVYYTNEAVKKIVNEPRQNTSVNIFTDGMDIFALSFGLGFSPTLQTVLFEADQENPEDGRLWKAVEKLKGQRFTVFIRDQTQDFDKQEEYEAFLSGRYKKRIVSTEDSDVELGAASLIQSGQVSRSC